MRVHERPREEAAALSTRSTPWGTQEPYTVLQKTLRRLGLPKVRLHALRAFFVTILLTGQVPVHVARELVGHADLATMQGYAAILASDRGAAAGVLDRVYLGAGGGQGTRQPRERTRRVRPMRRFGRLTRRMRALRTRVARRVRGAGNTPATPQIDPSA